VDLTNPDPDPDPQHCFVLYEIFVLYLKRSMTPTMLTAAPKRSGRWLAQAPTSIPPCEPPLIVNLADVVYRSFIRVVVTIYF
jgi:hypothetical protein